MERLYQLDIFNNHCKTIMQHVGKYLAGNVSDLHRCITNNIRIDEEMTFKSFTGNDLNDVFIEPCLCHKYNDEFITKIIFVTEDSINDIESFIYYIYYGPDLGRDSDQVKVVHTIFAPLKKCAEDDVYLYRLLAKVVVGLYTYYEKKHHLGDDAFRNICLYSNMREVIYDIQSLSLYYVIIKLIDEVFDIKFADRDNFVKGVKFVSTDHYYFITEENLRELYDFVISNEFNYVLIRKETKKLLENASNKYI